MVLSYQLVACSLVVATSSSTAAALLVCQIKSNCQRSAALIKAAG